jgi:hypothetical protein
MNQAQARSFGTLTGRAEMAQHALGLVRKARLELVLLSYDLDPRLYGSEEFAEAVKDFLLSHERARLRGLVQSPKSAMRSSNRLVELARRLSSRIELRQLPEDRGELREDQLICDARHFMRRRDPGDLEATFFDDAPLKARDLLKEFDELWQVSTVAREFSDLKI